MLSPESRKHSLAVVSAAMAPNIRISASHGQQEHYATEGERRAYQRQRHPQPRKVCLLVHGLVRLCGLLLPVNARSPQCRHGNCETAPDPIVHSVLLFQVNKCVKRL